MKGFCYLCLRPSSLSERRTFFFSSLKRPGDSYLRFRIVLPHPVSCFFFLCRPPSTSQQTILDTASVKDRPGSIRQTS